MEVKLETLRRGSVFSIGALEFVVIRVEEREIPTGHDRYFVESTKDLFKAAFDEDGNNNWTDASLRKYLNGPWLDELMENHPALVEGIIPTYRDLTSDDGLKDYGAVLDKVTLLTAQEYRESRDLHMEPPEGWRWLITADSTPSGGGTSFARLVITDGSLYIHYAYSGRYGVRPALTLSSAILVSVKSDDEKPEPLTPQQKEMALYEDAVEKFGEEAQLLMAVEEMSELQKAILKYLRFRNFAQGREEDVMQAIAEERADVEIMLNQLEVIFGDNSDMVCAKLDHLKEIVRGPVGEEGHR